MTQRPAPSVGVIYRHWGNPGWSGVKNEKVHLHRDHVCRINKVPVWHESLGLFDNVKNLRGARLFVEALDRWLQPDDEGWGQVPALPSLEEIGRYGSDNELAAFLGLSGRGLVCFVSGREKSSYARFKSVYVHASVP